MAGWGEVDVMLCVQSDVLIKTTPYCSCVVLSGELVSGAGALPWAIDR